MEEIATQVSTESGAQERGAYLGRTVALTIQQRGASNRLVQGFGLVDLRFTLLELAASSNGMLAKVAASALAALRLERQSAQQSLLKSDGTSAQCVKARRMLGWSQLDLAARSLICATYIGEYELTGQFPGRIALRQMRLDKIFATLEAAGIEFVDQGGGGARMRRARE